MCTARGFVADLMNPVDDVIVQQLLFVVVQGGVHLLVTQSGVLPDLLEGVLLQQTAVLKHSHQHILTDTQQDKLNQAVIHMQVKN